MKKIINGKLYDTTTAKLVGSYYTNLHTHQAVAEYLYRKRTGEYFIHGEGGPRSKYARCISPNSFIGGEDITPVTYAEAMAWAEEHMDADAYIAHFGPVSEDSEDRTTLSISISSAAADVARRAAGLAGVTLSAYIESLIIMAK